MVDPLTLLPLSYPPHCSPNDFLEIQIQYHIPITSEICVCMCVLSYSKCPALCNPIDGSPLGSSVPEILQARILEWVAISFSWKVIMWGSSFLGNIFDILCLKVSVLVQLSCVLLLVTLWTAALQASLSITNSWSLLKLMSIESVMASNHLILCHPLLLLPSIFPNIRVFSNESLLIT